MSKVSSAIYKFDRIVEPLKKRKASLAKSKAKAKAAKNWSVAVPPNCRDAS